MTESWKSETNSAARKEGVRFAAISVEEGLLILGVYEAPPDGHTSPRDASRALDAQDDALPPRNLA